VVEHPTRDGAPGVPEMVFHQAVDQPDVRLVHQRLELHHVGVAPIAEAALAIEDEGHSSAHAGSEVPAGGPEHHHHAGGHVLATVVTHALHHRRGAAVPHREPLAGEPGGEQLAAGRAVEDGVSDDDVLLRGEARSCRRPDDDPASGETLAHVVVGVSLELEGHSCGQERAEALPGRALQPDADAVVGQARGSPEPGDLPGEHRPDRAVRVPHRNHDEARSPSLERRPRTLEQHPVQVIRDVLPLHLDAVAWSVRRSPGGDQHRRQVEAPGLPVSDVLPAAEQIPPPDDLVEAAGAEPGQQLTHLARDEEEEVDHAFRRPGEALAKLRVLRGDAHRAGVEMALAQHHAAHRHQ